MKKHIRQLAATIAIVLCVTLIPGCNDSDPIPNSEKQIKSFVFKASDNVGLTSDISATINESDFTIMALIPDGANISSLKATVTLSESAVVSPESGVVQDFSSPVYYLVTAEDGTEQMYTVRVLYSHDRAVLIDFFNENPDNTLGWDLNDITMDSWFGVTHQNGVVHSLIMDTKKISTLTALSGLSQIKVLEIPRNIFTGIPVELMNIVSLERLWLNGNDVSSIPPEIKNLQNLKNLNLGGMKLTQLSVEVCELTGLTYLNISENPLTSVPAEIGDLSSLQTLSINATQITDVPSQIGDLTSLTYLGLLRNSKLTSVPSTLGQLTNLEKLLMYENKLTSIPAELGNLSRMKELNMTKNDFTSIPQAVCDMKTKYGTTLLVDEGVICQ